MSATGGVGYRRVSGSAPQRLLSEAEKARRRRGMTGWCVCYVLLWTGIGLAVASIGRRGADVRLRDMAAAPVMAGVIAVRLRYHLIEALGLVRGSDGRRGASNLRAVWLSVIGCTALLMPLGWLATKRWTGLLGSLVLGPLVGLAPATVWLDRQRLKLSHIPQSQTRTEHFSVLLCASMLLLYGLAFSDYLGQGIDSWFTWLLSHFQP